MLAGAYRDTPTRFVFGSYRVRIPVSLSTILTEFSSIFAASLGDCQDGTLKYVTAILLKYFTFIAKNNAM